jgi:hypothetical protein
MWLLFFFSVAVQGNLDALMAKVGKEAVLQSDLDRFSSLRSILKCQGAQMPELISSEKLPLLNLYIEEELIYKEARNRKLAVPGGIQMAIKSIHDKPECRKRWMNLGNEYREIWRTEQRTSEGPSFLVRELEKRLLVNYFREQFGLGDGDSFIREGRVRHQVKVYLE